VTGRQASKSKPEQVVFRGLPAAGEKGKLLWWLLGLALLALWIRLFRIELWSFWEDEVFTLREISRSWGDLLSFRQNHYPLFPLLEKLFLPFLPGSGEGSYRLLAALFGVLSVPLLAVSGRALLGKGPGLFAAFLLLVSPWHVFWSQSCRYYTLVALLVLLTAWVFWWGIQKKRGDLGVFLALPPAVLAVFSHPSAAFVLLGLAAYMVRELLVKRGPGGRRARRRAILFLVFSLLAGAALMKGLKTSLELYGSAKAPNPFLHLPHTLAFYVGVPLLAGSLLSWWPLRRRAPDAADLLLLLIAVPSVGVTVLGFWVRVTAQYLFYTLPFFCLLSAWGAWALWEKGRKGAEGGRTLPSLLAAGLLVVPLLCQLYLYSFHEYGWRPRWREAARFVRDRLGEGEKVAAANSTPLEYYLNPYPSFTGDMPRFVEDLESWNISRKVEALLESGKKSWIVVNLPFFLEKDPSGRQLDRILANYRLAALYPAFAGPRDLGLYVFERLPSERGGSGGSSPGGGETSSSSSR